MHVEHSYVFLIMQGMTLAPQASKKGVSPLRPLCIVQLLFYELYSGVQSTFAADAAADGF